MKAPQIDLFLEHTTDNPYVSEKKNIKKLWSVFNIMVLLEEQGDDELRSIWVEAERGTLADFGSYKDYRKDGIVESKEEFQKLWLEYYPGPVKWYKFSVNRYKGEVYFYFDSKLTFIISTDKKPGYGSGSDYNFIDWVDNTARDVIKRIRNDQKGYNMNIAKNLPYEKRVGRILRKDYWNIFPEKRAAFNVVHTPEKIRMLEKLATMAGKDEMPEGFKRMTAGKFFRCCELGYDANNYFKKSERKLSPKEKYLRMADGRDCGLTKIDESSETAFREWFEKDSHCGGHPWEICRGGNSTHISLYVLHNDGGWLFGLDGSSRVRVLETVKIAFALYSAHVPFMLRYAPEILKMVTGTDHIGIVPEDVVPRYCHSFFPKEDNVHDFMNLGMEHVHELIQKAYWYPEPEIRLK